MRTSGVLMPIFSLSSSYGIGTLGREAYKFVDFLKKAKQTYWQILPINPTNYGDSPYQSFSSYAGNPYFIDIELLIEKRLLTVEEAQSFDFGSGERIDYEALYNNRFKLLKIAFNRFKPDESYLKFKGENAFWLDDYATFMALKDKNDGKAWNEWPHSLKTRDIKSLEHEKIACANEIEFYCFLQFEFFEQWRLLKAYANKNNIKIIGDIPIYVALDSADVWANPKQFLLDDNLTPTKVAGVPPDIFCDDGQLWGNPLYNWQYMKSDGYSWWKGYLSHALDLYDVVRIDHFRGFEAYFAIPYKDKNAKGGKWEKGPNIDLFNSLKKELGDNLPIIAEDLGVITPAVRKMLGKTGFPGMKVMQFAFDSDSKNDYLPHNYERNCVVYTGTHDNDTIMGWLKSAKESEVKSAKKYMNYSEDNGFNWAMIKYAMASVADTCIIMAMDLFGLDGDGRINTPSTLGNNWNVRIKGEYINDWLAGVLAEITVTYGRENIAE